MWEKRYRVAREALLKLIELINNSINSTLLSQRWYATNLPVVKSEIDLWHRKISKRETCDARKQVKLRLLLTILSDFIVQMSFVPQYGHRISFVCGIVFYDIDRSKTSKYHDQNLIRVARNWNFHCWANWKLVPRQLSTNGHQKIFQFSSS